MTNSSNLSSNHDIPAVIKHISCYNTYYIKYFPGESMANSDIDSKIKELQKIIDDSDNIVFFDIYFYISFLKFIFIDIKGLN